MSGGRNAAIRRRGQAGAAGAAEIPRGEYMIGVVLDFDVGGGIRGDGRRRRRLLLLLWLWMGLRSLMGMTLLQLLLMLRLLQQLLPAEAVVVGPAEARGGVEHGGGGWKRKMSPRRRRTRIR